VLPVFARRDGFFDYALTVSEPIALGRRPGAEALQAGAQRAVSAMQAWVEQCPTQWFHFADE
jgi:predicted LPLAT superfamily acyltransferase